MLQDGKNLDLDVSTSEKTEDFLPKIVLQLVTLEC